MCRFQGLRGYGRACTVCHQDMNTGPMPARDFVPPPPVLAAHVDRIWSMDTPSGVPLPRLLPGTGAELMFQLGAPMAALEADGTCHTLPRALVFCLRSRSVQLTAGGPGPIRLVSVRLRLSGLRHFTATRMESLADGFTPAEEVLGADASLLLESLGSAPTLAARASLLCAVLASRLTRHAKPDTDSDEILRRLYYIDPAERLAPLADSFGLSLRQTERKVAGAAGISPKRFRRLARFHHTMRELHLSNGARALEAALANGFHDQAHFIHDCSELTGLAPGRIVNPSKPMSHFYNTSLRKRPMLATSHDHNSINHRNPHAQQGQ